MTIGDLLAKLQPWQEPAVNEPAHFFKTVQPLVRDICEKLSWQSDMVETFTDMIRARDVEIDNLKARLDAQAIEFKRHIQENQRLLILIERQR